MDTKRIGLVTVARSDSGHTDLLRQALGCVWISPEEIRRHAGFDAVMIATDRWEMGEAAMRALGAGLPILQLHAGESTPFAFDDEIRHFVSGVAALRFCCHDVHRQRLLAMGIRDDTIHVCGAPGLDRLLLRRLSREDLGHTLGLDPTKPWALVILHPTTLVPSDPATEIRQAEDAIGDRQALWFTPCDDPGRDEYLRPGQIDSVTDLQWSSLLYEADVLIGNSSALVIEAPFVGLRTIEIGKRQWGRKRVLYGDGKSVPRIVEVLRAWTP